MARSPAQRVIAQSLPLGCHLGPLLNLDQPSDLPRTGQPLHPLTTTAKNHHTTKPQSNVHTYLDAMSSSSAAHLVALDRCQLDLVDPVPLHPLDPQQPQTVITLRNSRRLFKPTSDCMARSHTQRLVAPDLPVGISKRTSDDMPSNVQTYLEPCCLLPRRISSTLF